MMVSRETVKNGGVYDVDITGYTADGAGVGRVDGQVVFVPRTIAGERVRVRIVNVGRTAAHGVVLEVLRASEHRVQPECPYFGRCGGCSFWHMDYAAELEAKRQRVLDAFARIGGVVLPDLKMNGAAVQTGYRNKVQFPVQAQNGRSVAGFYRERSHEVIAIDTCRIQPECADRIRQGVLEWMEHCHIPAYDERRHAGVVRHIYVRRAQNGAALCCVVLNADRTPRAAELVAAVRRRAPETVGVVASYNTARGNVVLGAREDVLWGDGALRDVLCGLEFSLAPRAFYQVNHDQAERLYAKAVEYAALDRAQTALDLYCGAGTITLCLAREAGKVYGVEIVEAAILNARENAARNGITNAEFFCADAPEAAQRFADAGLRPDVIVVDPPRKGVAPEGIAAMVRMRPERIVYVSCDPATLARDVRALGESGYVLRAAEAFDLFPRCAHVETVCWLAR